MSTAVRLFAEQGFDATSVQEIVDGAAVTKGALYHYFESKDDLLYEIYHALISRQLADFERIVARRSPAADTVRALITELVETTCARIDEAAVFAREVHRLDRERMAAVRADRRRYHVGFRELIERAQQSAEFSRVASAEMVTLVVFGMINQLPQWYRRDGLRTPDDLAAELADFVLAALAHRP